MRALAQWAAQLSRPPKKARLLRVDSREATIEYRLVTQFMWRTKPQTIQVQYGQLPSLRDEKNKPTLSISSRKSSKSSQRDTVTIKDHQEVKCTVAALVDHAFPQVGFPEGKLSPEQVAVYEKRTPVIYAPSWDFLVPLLVLVSARVLYSPFWREALLTAQFRTYLFDRIGGESGVDTAKYALRVVSQIHAVEACIMSVIALRRGSPAIVWLCWSLGAFFIGFRAFSQFFELNPLPLRYKSAKKAEN